jgi:hypothetical protein
VARAASACWPRRGGRRGCGSRPTTTPRRSAASPRRSPGCWAPAATWSSRPWWCQAGSPGTWSSGTPPAAFDPYPFILLTLALSLQASYAAPLILLAQNRRAERDRQEAENDRRATARTQADTEYPARELAAIRLALG